MKLSIVATLYQSAFYINEFHKRVSATAKQLVGEDYEIVLVNDGSPDNSLEIATKLTEADSHVIIIDLSRNFGHHKAMMTGLANASGEHIFLIDCDLEEDPECLIDFSKQLTANHCDVVYGVQERRKGKIFERLSGQCFWYLLNILTNLSLPANVCTIRLMTRRYVNALLSHQEREIFIAGLWHITGFHQVPKIIKKKYAHTTTYTFSKKLKLLVNSVTSFSNIPLISIFYIGIAISLVAGVYVTYLISHWFFFDKPLSGWTSMIASIWLIGGLIMSSLGIIGIYLSKIFSETKKRPYTIIRQIYKRV